MMQARPIQSLPEPHLQPMPPKVLADRFNEMGIEAGLARALIFGGCPNANIMSEAFMRGQHVLIVRGSKAVILPPYHKWQTARTMLEVEC